MMGRSWARAKGMTVLITVVAEAWCCFSPTWSEASPIKGEGSPPVFLPSTLLVEAGERLAAPPAKTLVAELARSVADSKQSPRSCSAVALRIPQHGTQLVTARHCADQRKLEVIDEQHSVIPRGEFDASGAVDLAILDVPYALPWPGLEMRSAATVELGERLCAFRLHRTPEGVGRERICGRVIERQARGEEAAGAGPLLVMSHPYPAGTSGSALVDREGRVVGIVVASTGVSGLAEPIDGVLGLQFSTKRAGGSLAMCDDSGVTPCVSR